MAICYNYIGLVFIAYIKFGMCKHKITVALNIKCIVVRIHKYGKS